MAIPTTETIAQKRRDRGNQEEADARRRRERQAASEQIGAEGLKPRVDERAVILPTSYFLLMKPIKKDEMSPGGIKLVRREGEDKNLPYGYVVSVGSECKEYKVGDLVIISPWGGFRFFIPIAPGVEDEFIFCKQKDVLGLIAIVTQKDYDEYLNDRECQKRFDSMMKSGNPQVKETDDDDDDDDHQPPIPPEEGPASV